jgi:hypothetical protein
MLTTPGFGHSITPLTSIYPSVTRRLEQCFNRSCMHGNLHSICSKYAAFHVQYATAINVSSRAQNLERVRGPCSHAETLPGASAWRYCGRSPDPVGAMIYGFWWFQGWVVPRWLTSLRMAMRCLAQVLISTTRFAASRVLLEVMEMHALRQVAKQREIA